MCTSDPQDPSGGSACCGATPGPVAVEFAGRGPATGIAGGLLTGTLPLVEAAPNGSSCCG